MATLTKADRRVNRKHVLEALRDETGGSGGDAAAARVKAYCRDPEGATTVEFAYVGGLTLRRFFIDPTKPNAAERRSLWQNLTQRMARSVPDPGGWDGTSDVKELQAIAEETE